MKTTDAIQLDGPWRFTPDPHADGESRGFWRTGFQARLWREVAVPSCFEAGCPELDSYEGLCWYRRAFAVPDTWQGRRVILRFEAVNYRAKVWLNNRFLGENHDGFLPFDFEIPSDALRAGKNVLAVSVDNAHHAGDVPGMHVGWRGFGGIVRDVYLLATDPLHVRDARIVATPGTDGGGDMECRVRAGNSRAEAEDVGVTMVVRDADGKTCAELRAGPVSLPAGAETDLVLKGAVAVARAWSPAAPVLYTASIRLETAGRPVDERDVSFGFRRIEATRDGLLLNGEPLFLTGFNRHEDSPHRALATDLETMRQDLDAMKEAGANMVRLCHYPHHPAEIDHCDRIGLLVFAEIPLYFWNDAEEGRRTNAERVTSATRQLERLVARDFNHPSIIFWSVSNETHENEPEVAESNRRLIRHARALDPTRLHVHVSNHWQSHPEFVEDDVMCINAYPSIDWGNGGHNPATYDGTQAAATWREKVTALRRRYPDKPVLVTEFGYGSIPGTHGHSLGEDEHARVIEAEFAAFDASLVCGALIWCWADHPWPAGRFLNGLALSPFGVVSRERRKLKPFWTARDLFRARHGIQPPPGKTSDPNSTTVIMVRANLDDIPDVPFPDGYGIRPMTLDDIGLWTDIQRDAEPYLTITDSLFRAEFGDDLGALGRRCFIVTDPRRCGVGTISAWYARDFRGEDYGRIHWVAVRPSAQGKGLGKAALAHALRVLAQWHDKCYLVTSTERIPAIRLYLAFGFQPDMHAPNAAAILRLIREQLAT